MIASQADRRPSTGAAVVWETYPSWAHFTWLYLFSALAVSRALLFRQFGVPGWDMWLIGAMLILLCAAAVRRWARYSLTLNEIVVTNGYTGRPIQSMALSDVREVSVKQGPVARFFDIGTVVVRSRNRERALSLRGVADPELVRERIEALAPHPIKRVAGQAEPIP
jgi:membrane protein YdbS with pleckstrin-like domain